MDKLIGLFATVALALAPEAIAAPKVTFRPTSFGVANVTPGGKVVIYGVGDGYSDGAELISKQSAILTADANGQLDVNIDHPAFRSIWLVMDLKADSYTLASPPGYQAVVLAVAPTLNTNFDTVQSFRPLSFVFIAHAPQGAWEAFSGDGSAADDDKRANGAVAATLRRFVPIGDSPPSPAHLVPGDLVLTIDPSSMAYATFRVPKGESDAH